MKKLLTPFSLLTSVFSAPIILAGFISGILQTPAPKESDNSPDELERKARFNNWLKTTKLKLDKNIKELNDEQIAVVFSNDSDVLVKARAGSGKTSTLVARTLYLIDHLKVEPQEILLVVFNTKARYQILDRLKGYLKSYKRIPHVMNFHSMARTVVKPPKDSVFMDEDEALKKDFITKIVNKLLLNDPKFSNSWEELNKGHFKDKHKVLNPFLDEKNRRYSITSTTRFIEVLNLFIGLAKKENLTPEKLEFIPADDPTSKIVKTFFDIAIKVYSTYEQELVKTKKNDWDGVIAKASKLLASGEKAGYYYNLNKEENWKVRLHSGIYFSPYKLKYLMIDEYQDFSRSFYELINAIRKNNPSLNVMCVGDDWQAINGWAGSHLRYFDDHPTFFPINPKKMEINTNFRSDVPIVDYGNAIMRGNGSPASSIKGKTEGKALLVDLDTYKPASLIEHLTFVQTDFLPPLLRILNKYDSNKSLQKDGDKGFTLLSRLNDHLPFNESKLRILLKKYLADELVNKHLEYHTVHKYKGKQKGVFSQTCG